jgi:anti-sigma B factor antagonist
VSGEVDINSSPDIKKTLDKVISSKKKKILVNFKDVVYIDSSGLATLVEFLKNIKAYGGRLKISNLSPKVKSLFEMTRLEKLFDIAQDETEAVQSFT